MENVKQLIYDSLYTYKSICDKGLMSSEVDIIKLSLQNNNLHIDNDKFNSFFYGVTCTMYKDKIVYYHHDVYNALINSIK